MVTDLEYALQRFSSFALEVIKPAIHPHRAPLHASVHQCRDAIPYAAATAATYRDVDPGFVWGPTWSTAWFRVRGAVPESMTGRVVALRFSSGTEALLWMDGVPRQGMGPNHPTYRAFDPARGGEVVEAYIEAACNHPFGASSFWWDSDERRARWQSETPGRLDACELLVVDEDVQALWCAYDFARQTLALMPDTSPRARALREALADATRRIDDRDVAGTAKDARRRLGEALRGGDATTTRCHAVGHAHIDTAWLWPIRETRRKCLRTFSTVLRLMERDDAFTFLCSQPQQYAWVEADAPPVFDAITERVREGRWEATGAMWIEPDCNVPSGESLVRQMTHGIRYFREKFGDDAPQRVLYLPDTFGFNAALPQIMSLAGLDLFVTNKLSWCQANEFPLVNFRWRGIDGTEVLAHCTPGHDYNATLEAKELHRGQTNAARLDDPATGIWLQPFGYGDGGGGPTEAMVHRARLSAACEGLPAVEMSTAGAFAEELHARADTLRSDGRDLRVWDGELYLELHRGTLTTHAWLKRANRRAEQALRICEWLAAGAPGDVTASESTTATRAALARDLDDAWKRVLLNQFHDILPGTSIAAVYEDAREDHAHVAATTNRRRDDGVAAWARAMDTTGLEAPLLVFNPHSVAAGGVVDVDGTLQYVDSVPALGATVVDRAVSVDIPHAVRVDGDVLSNGLITAQIDRAGRIVSLRRAGQERDACGTDTGHRALNQLVLYEDRPRAWDAWDIDAEYVEKAEPLEGAASTWRVVEHGPLRAAIEVEYAFGRGSMLVQRCVLEAGSDRVDVQCTLDWQEDRRMLRALFPVDVRARRATCEIQYGHLERPTHRNTSWERARFEFCAHTWIDVSEAGFGVALMNDGKYGHSCEGGTLGLTLARGPRWPDAGADLGAHEFTYALTVHDGDWRAAGVDRAAHRLNAPLWAVPLSADDTRARRAEATTRTSWSPVTITTRGAAGIICPAFTFATDDDRIILRIVETHGGHGPCEINWNVPAVSVETVDVLERPRAEAGFVHDAAARRTTLDLRPFQIVTLAARVDWRS